MYQNSLKIDMKKIENSACRGCQNGFYSDCYRKGCVVADGVERGLLTVNRQLPGPPIHVRKSFSHFKQQSTSTKTRIPISTDTGLQK